MNKNSTLVGFTKFLSAFLFGFVILGIISFALDVEPFQITPSFILVNGSRFIVLLISSLYFLLSNTPASFKTKLFPSPAKSYKFLDSLFMIQMLFSLCTCLITIRFSLLEGVFTSAYYMQNIAFSAFFVLIYLCNKISINKAFIYILGGVYIGFWYAYNFFFSYDIIDFISVAVIVFYMMIFGLFSIPPLKSFFYHTVIIESINEKETDMVCISATKNDKGETEMLMITDRYEHKYIVYNHTTNEITRVDENNIMNINKNLKKDLELYFLCNRL